MRGAPTPAPLGRREPTRRLGWGKRCRVMDCCSSRAVTRRRGAASPTKSTILSRRACHPTARRAVTSHMEAKGSPGPRRLWIGYSVSAPIARIRGTDPHRKRYRPPHRERGLQLCYGGIVASGLQHCTGAVCGLVSPSRVDPHTPVGRDFSIEPLRGFGRVSLSGAADLRGPRHRRNIWRPCGHRLGERCRDLPPPRPRARHPLPARPRDAGPRAGGCRWKAGRAPQLRHVPAAHTRGVF
jgi:hypothetical protein